MHRKHHAFTDVPGDPHSPKLLGWKTVQLKNVALYRREARNEVTMARYAKDLPPDKWDRLLFDHAFVGLAIGIAILIAIFGVWLGLLAALVHAVSYLSSNAAVNSAGHTFGKRPYENTGTNLLVARPHHERAKAGTTTTMRRPPRPTSASTATRSTSAGGSSGR